MNRIDSEKKLIFIAAMDDEGTIIRTYSDCIYELFRSSSQFAEYTIEPHYLWPEENLYTCLRKSIRGEYEGFIVLVDSLEGFGYSPDVMFEFGGIYYLRKPFILLSSRKSEELPSVIKGLGMELIPSPLIDYVHECCSERSKIVNIGHLYMDGHESDAAYRISSFLDSAFSKYKLSLRTREIEDFIDDDGTVLDEIRTIKTLLLNTAEYIDGEAAAFDALQAAVRQAQNSLRTTRFANESIVAQNVSTEKYKFMQSLYEVSRELGGQFERIICNNHPSKWNDIYNILLYGGNGVKVYVRKHTFSIHFELVIIDEKVAFIHFYQTESRGQKDSYDGIERLNSTLKLQGSTICKKLANIFDRLHHRDFDADAPKEPSRTLLGIPLREEEWNSSFRDFGRFSVDRSIRKYDPYSRNGGKRASSIIRMFREAFTNWKFDDLEDKLNMLVGIALVEESTGFINETWESGLVDDSVYEKALQMYEDNKEQSE